MRNIELSQAVVFEEQYKPFHWLAHVRKLVTRGPVIAGKSDGDALRKRDACILYGILDTDTVLLADLRRRDDTPGQLQSWKVISQLSVIGGCPNDFPPQH